MANTSPRFCSLGLGGKERLTRVDVVMMLDVALRVRLIALGGSRKREEGDWANGDGLAVLMDTLSFGGVTGRLVSVWTWLIEGEECRRSESCLRDGKRVMRGLRMLSVNGRNV